MYSSLIVVAPITRRTFFELSLAGFAATCASLPDVPVVPQDLVRLHSRPHAVTSESVAAGEVHRLGVGAERDGVFYVPRSRKPGTASPLIVMLHGAGGMGARAISRLQPYAEVAGAILLAPDSRGETWDLITRHAGDAPFIDRALEKLFSSVAIEPARIVVAGFSDGATYALTLGLSNARLFSGVAAFSPGFLVLGSEATGHPRLFVSHGIHDEVLPIARCGRPVVEKLRARGYAVDFVEFDGPHALPPAKVLMDGMDRLLAR